MKENKFDDQSVVQMNRTDVIRLLRTSLDFFEFFFLGDYLTLESPDFHRESWATLTDTDKPKSVWAWPRGHAKSTLAKLSAPYIWLFTDLRFTTYTSSIFSTATADCRDIMSMLECQNFRSVFGSLDYHIERDAQGFYQFDMPCVNEHDEIYIKKDCILKAFGSNSKIRGTLYANQRPQYGIADDIEDNDIVNSPTQQSDLIDWFYGPYLQAFDKHRQKHLVLGNMLSVNSLLFDLVENSPLWYARRYGCIKPDGTPLWPELNSMADIQAAYNEYQRIGKLAVWYAESMNAPVAAESSIITVDKIQFLPPLVPGAASIAFITVDPADSLKATSDDRAVAVHAYADGKWRTVEVVAGKFAPEQLYFHIVHMCIKWHTRCVGIEASGFKVILETLLKVYMEKYKQRFNIHLISHKNIPKTDRIKPWCALLRTGDWYLQEGLHQVVDQLIAYNPCKANNVDDIIDSCSMSVLMLQQFGQAIREQYSMNTIEGSYETSNSICPV